MWRYLQELWEENSFVQAIGLSTIIILLVIFITPVVIIIGYYWWTLVICILGPGCK